MSEGGKEHSEAMRRYLGAGIVAALRDDDVTEIYVNAGGGAVWLDRRSVGRVRSAAVLGEAGADADSRARAGVDASDRG
jgi:type IV secretory pathway ATPase VirB11/archaellum biosynthesis ATPase